MKYPLLGLVAVVAGASMPFASPQAISVSRLRDAPKAGAQSAQSLNVTPTNANQTTPAPVGQTNTSPDLLTPTFGTISFIASVCLTAMVVKCLKDYCNRRQNATGNQDASSLIENQSASAELVYRIKAEPVNVSAKPQPARVGNGQKSLLDELYGNGEIKPQFALPDSTIKKFQGDVNGLQLSRPPSSASSQINSERSC